ncbi:MAG: YggT family protein [Dehalobacter sp. 4CP]|uniref:YggT family protein n=1 Tax=Dehalobacter sp. CP TaxID=2594474 RepID=UPI0013C902EC|nr:YggT family protein [Dehalobacter sp.]NBJ14490.1 YggT family protein [Dehalobacter sp. 4CP]
MSVDIINRPNRGKSKESLTARRIVYYILGILEILLAFRLVFKILGANPNSGFVSFIYSLSQVFLVPFTAIFRSAATQGIETNAVLEPSTVIAMIVYALVAWGIVKLIIIFTRSQNKDQV